MPDYTPKHLREDANNRAVRTGWQGLLLDLVIAALLAIVTVLGDVTEWGAIQWTIMGTAVFKTVSTAALAWFMRFRLDRSGFPTPLPPEFPGKPNDPEPDVEVIVTP